MNRSLKNRKYNQKIKYIKKYCAYPYDKLKWKRFKLKQEVYSQGDISILYTIAIAIFATLLSCATIIDKFKDDGILFINALLIIVGLYLLFFTKVGIDIWNLVTKKKKFLKLECMEIALKIHYKRLRAKSSAAQYGHAKTAMYRARYASGRMQKTSYSRHC